MTPDLDRSGGTVPCEIGSRLELFVDDWLMSSLDGARLRLHHPIRREVAYGFDAPWEASSHFVTILEHEGEHRAYYYNRLPDFFSGGRTDESLTTASVIASRDGIHWERPSLGLHDWHGSTANNIVMLGEQTETFACFADANPAAKPQERFKGYACHRIPGANRVKQRWPVLVPYVSEDGYRWRKLREEPIITDGAFDSQNVVYWDSHRGHYVAFYRDFVNREKKDPDRVRGIKWSASDDWLSWPDGQWLDYGDAPLEHFYTNATIAYHRAPHIYMAFPMRFVPERPPIGEHPHQGLSDSVFMTSRDGLHWDRTYMEAFVVPGMDDPDWTDRTNGVAWGVLQTGPAELSLYWIEHYDHPSVRLRRGTLRLDGFASLSAGYGGGEMTTRPLTFAGRELVLNAATSAVGWVRAELQDEAGRPIPGFTLADSAEHYGNAIELPIRWSGGADVSSLAGRPVRLRLALKDADVYAFQFRP